MTVRPELRNQPDVQRALIEHFPPLLRDAGIGGTATVWFYVDETGRVRKTQLSKSSGYPALDDAALRVAAVMQFSPAQNRAEIVPVWVEIPILFTARPRSPRPPEQVPSGGVPTARERVPVSPAGAPVQEPARVEARRPVPQLSAQPTFTPMTARPELQNAREVQQALIRSYPPALRDAGIGGTAVIWFFVDEEGKVAKLQLSKSSGYPALDEAALFVGSTMRFAPARNRDRVVPVWIEIPILFTAK
jgi:protein TonB